MPNIWIPAEMVVVGDMLVVNGFGTSDTVNVTKFVGYTWITNAEGNTYVYADSEIVQVVCEYDYIDYSYVDYDEEYDRQEREWLEDEKRYSEERSFFFLVSHIEPAILDGWFSG